MAIFRLPRVLAETGLGRSQFYRYVQVGLMPRPVRIGDRASGLPAEEVEAINRARIAGQSDEQIRALVERLHAARVAAVEVA